MADGSRLPRISSLEEEGVLCASKWSKCQVLLDPVEMEELMRHLPRFSIYCVSAPVSPEGACVPHDLFLSHYRAYVESLKGKPWEVDRAVWGRLSSSILTVSPDLLFALPVSEGRYLIRPTEPIVQMQAHAFHHSRADGKLHSMVLGKESIGWGIQFSYPQLVQHPRTQQFSKVTSDYPNTVLFLEIVRWLRTHARPTPFWIDQSRVNSPMRIGQKCLSWIREHVSLRERGISVVGT